MNLYLSPKIRNYWINSNNYYSIQDEEKFLEYFFHFIDNKKITLLTQANTCIFDIQLNTIKMLEDNKLNIMLCVENCSKHKHYKHYNKYNNFGNNKIQLYLYNHISRIIKSDTYLAIPIIYIQIDYFNLYYNSIKPSVVYPFDKRKFCLITTKNNFNNNFELLNSIGECHHISEYSNIIANKSCYHSQELLNLFSQFKFIYVSENTFTDGYITEKIFNSYFSRTIPLYFGPSDTPRYFNKKTYINMNDEHKTIIDKINILNTNEEEYNTIINTNKINVELNNENYKEICNEFINNFISIIS